MKSQPLNKERRVFVDTNVLIGYYLNLDPCVKAVIGSKMSCYYYVTENTKDYKYNSIHAISPSNIFTIGT